MLARILDDAVRDRLLVANPARGVKLPPVVKRQNVYLTAAQLHALAIQAGRYGPLVLLLGTAGLRWGEAVALRVSDIDFLRRRIELHRNAVTVSGHGAVVGTLKSGKARTVPLAGFVIDELAATCRGKGRDELIWPSATGGYLAPPWGRVVARGRGAALPKGRPDLSGDYRARPAAHRGVAGHLGGGEREGRPAHAGALLGGDDAGRVRRSVR